MKKNSHQSASPLEKLDFLDSMEEHVVVQWFNAHWQKLLYGFLGAFLLLFSVYAWKARGITKAEIDYYDANQIFQVFQAGGEGSQEAFDKLTQVLKRQHDLQSKYDGLIAQILIDRGNIDQAIPFAQEALSRVTGDHLPFYIEYSANTLLIAKNQDVEALQSSLALKAKMLESIAKSENVETPSFGGTLFAFNLLRIATLEQKVGSPAGELAAWNEWQNYSKGYILFESNAVDNKAFFTLANGISEGKVSLQDYINTRLQQLGNVEK
ncbi:MAG: hypothetical protein H0U49_03830 [Parachlamydiaceae bacterium]|nr:hypothetical protein [Parachlamydiaceae bacterium]